MTPDEARARVEHEADAASVGLYEGISTGVAVAEQMLKVVLRPEDYRFLLPLNARAVMRNYWLDHGLAPGWRVAGNSRLMGQTILRNDEANMEMRLLKERRSPERMALGSLSI